jgi:hypothetical protein
LSGQSTPDQRPLAEDPGAAVFVATRPSELIVFNGQPNYVP